MDWNPEQYDKFRAAREQPFADVVGLVDGTRLRRVVDLGCGPGNLTRRLAEKFRDADIVGIDSSPAMLAQAAPLGGLHLRFVQASIEEFAAGGGVDGSFDLIFSNAALHWVHDHQRVIPKLVERLGIEGQLAVQLPTDDYNPARVIFSEVAGWRYEMGTLDIAMYAELLNAAGLDDLTVFEKIYPHILPDADAVLEWAKGTALLPYLERLPPGQHAHYLDEVRRRLQAKYTARPVFFPFRRIIFHGRRA